MRNQKFYSGGSVFEPDFPKEIDDLCETLLAVPGSKSSSVVTTCLPSPSFHKGIASRGG